MQLSWNFLFFKVVKIPLWSDPTYFFTSNKEKNHSLISLCDILNELSVKMVTPSPPPPSLSQILWPNLKCTVFTLPVKTTAFSHKQFTFCGIGAKRSNRSFVTPLPSLNLALCTLILLIWCLPFGCTEAYFLFDEDVWFLKMFHTVWARHL